MALSHVALLVTVAGVDIGACSAASATTVLHKSAFTEATLFA